MVRRRIQKATTSFLVVVPKRLLRRVIGSDDPLRYLVNWRLESSSRDVGHLILVGRVRRYPEAKIVGLPS